MNRHATEHLKGFIAKIFEAFQHGAGSDTQPITVDLALAMIWREVDVVAQNDSPRAFRKTLWLRVRASKEAVEIAWPLPNKITTIRCIGPREEGHGSVYYVTYSGVSIAQAYDIVNDLRRRGCEVRDYHYGCFRL